MATTPGYPVFGTYSKYLGGLVHQLPLLEGNDFLPDLESVPKDVLGKAKVLVLNYPNNPTGGAAIAGNFSLRGQRSRSQSEEPAGRHS